MGIKTRSTSEKEIELNLYCDDRVLPFKSSITFMARVQNAVVSSLGNPTIRPQREYARVVAGSGVLVVLNIEHGFLYIPFPRVGWVLDTILRSRAALKFAP
jgi:hypothetical protein